MIEARKAFQKNDFEKSRLIHENKIKNNNNYNTISDENNINNIGFSPEGI